MEAILYSQTTQPIDQLHHQDLKEIIYNQISMFTEMKLFPNILVEFKMVFITSMF